jgi:hypothetical protein
MYIHTHTYIYTHTTRLDAPTHRINLDDLELLRDLLQACGVNVVENRQLSNEQEGSVRGMQLLGGGLPGMANPVVLQTLLCGVALGRVDHKDLVDCVCVPSVGNVCVYVCVCKLGKCVYKLGVHARTARLRIRTVVLC